MAPPWRCSPPLGGLPQVTTDLPAAVVDLRTADGDGPGQGALALQRRPGGRLDQANDIAPHAQAADFDDSAWEAIEPAALETRRSRGRLAFNWYRTGSRCRRRWRIRRAGSTVVLELVVDDYAEIWVDGKLPLVLGQTGGQVIKGFNAPNRVVLTNDARPGQQIQLAIFGINGPVSQSAGQFHLDPVGDARLLRNGTRRRRRVGSGEVVRARSATRPHRSAGSAAGEARGRIPVHRGAGVAPRRLPAVQRSQREHHLSLVSRGRCRVFRSKSGYTGFDIGRYHQPGSNGLTLDPKGRLTINEHGNRRVTRLERNGEHHRAGRPLRWQAAQQPQRPGLSLRRGALLHRSAVRPAGGVRRPGEGAAVQRRVHGRRTAR